MIHISHVGISKVKTFRLQMLPTRFEELRMEEVETFDEFYACLNDMIWAVRT